MAVALTRNGTAGTSHRAERRSYAYRALLGQLDATARARTTSRTRPRVSASGSGASNATSDVGVDLRRSTFASAMSNLAVSIRSRWTRPPEPQRRTWITTSRLRRYSVVFPTIEVCVPCNRDVQFVARNAARRTEKRSSCTMGNRTVSAMQSAQCRSVPDDGSVQLQRRG